MDIEFLLSMRWPFLGLGVLALVLVHRYLGTTKATARQLIVELSILGPAYVAYSAVRGMVDERHGQAFHRAIDVIELEQTLGIFWEPSLQQHVLHVDWLVNLANWTYVWGHLPVIVFAATWLFLLHREEYGVYRNAFLISGTIGLVIFATVPVAPPRFMDAWGFVDTLAERSHSQSVLQPGAFVNQYAAMPSLHFGWNLLVGIALFRHSRVLIVRMVGLAFPIVMFASIVLTANHYIIDGLAGGTVALIALGVATAFNMLLTNFERAAARHPLTPTAM